MSLQVVPQSLLSDTQLITEERNAIVWLSAADYLDSEAREGRQKGLK